MAARRRTADLSVAAEGAVFDRWVLAHAVCTKILGAFIAVIAWLCFHRCTYASLAGAGDDAEITRVAGCAIRSGSRCAFSVGAGVERTRVAIITEDRRVTYAAGGGAGVFLGAAVVIIARAPELQLYKGA